MGTSRLCDLPPVTYYRPPDAKSSFHIVADQHILHMRDMGVQVDACDLDFNADALISSWPSTPLAIVHPLFLFRNWGGLDFAEVIEGLARRHRVLLGMEVADSDRISERFAQWANHPRIAGIMLPSRFSCRAFRNSGVTTPLRVVPHGVMTEQPSGRFEHLRGDGRAVALGFATRDPHRKGWDLLCAVMAEFPSCHFVIKASRQGENYFAGCSNALIVREWLLPADLASLYANSDCLISLHRGGAFELHCAEAMAYGLPVVATRHGCVLDYLNDGNAWLVDVDGPASVYPSGDDHCGTGAVAGVDAACRKIREVLSDREAAQQRSRAAMAAVRRKLSWRRVTRKLIAFAQWAWQLERAGARGVAG